MKKNINEIKLNIVIPVYNTEKFIAETIQSILSQTFPFFNVIFVNDGSTDNTLNIIKEYCAKDNRFNVISIENSGPGAARNKGLDYAAKYYSDFTLILDADDIYKPTMFETMINRAIETESEIVICRSNQLDNRDNKINSVVYVINEGFFPGGKNTFAPSEIKDYIFMFCIGWSWDKLISSDLIYRNNLRFQEIQNTDDAYFVFIALTKANRISCLKDELVTHRVNISNSTSNTRTKDLSCFWKAISAIKNELIQSNTYKIYERGFINWSMHFSMWYLRSLPIGKEQEKLFYEQKNIYLPQLEINKYEPSYFYLPYDYNLYAIVINDDYKKFLKAIKGKSKLKERAIKLSKKSKLFNFVYKILRKIYNKYNSFKIKYKKKGKG